MNTKEKISNYQVTVIVASAIIGAIVLVLPRLATSEVKVGGSLATLLGGLFSLILLLVIATLCKRFPNLTMIEFSQVILGKFLGRLYGVIFAGYCILVTGVILRTFADALKLILLPRTPLEFIMVAMLLVSLYLVQYGISSISKISELFFPLIIISILLLILLNLTDAELFQLRPMLSNGMVPILKAIPKLFLVYLGYEVVYFLSPFMRTPGKILIYSSVGVIIPIIIYTSIVAIAVMTFGTRATRTLVYPTVILARRINFPGGFAERFDIFFIIFWILAAFTTIAIYLYLSGISSTRLIGFRNYKPFVFMIAPFVYLIAILPQNVLHIDLLSQVAGISGAIIMGFSIPMLIIAIMRKKGGKQHA